MAFWNRGEDPWDMDPAKRRAKSERESREPMENPLDRLKVWSQERKAQQAAEDAAQEAVSLGCPWCGKPMRQGYIASGQHGLIWTPGRLTTRSAWLGPGKEKAEGRLRVDNEGGLVSYKTVWHCPDCEKMVLDAKGLRHPNASWLKGIDDNTHFPGKGEEAPEEGSGTEEEP